MKYLFDEVSLECSKIVTRKYSTSFTLGILFLDKRFHKPIYSIYGFVRFADEIVDSFHNFDKRKLLGDFEFEAYEAIKFRISLNPILNSFQETVRKYDISIELIDSFLESMKMDLGKVNYNSDNYSKYIYGSAEAVGLMCLHVFTEGDKTLYEKLKPYASKLGAAFQKVNFLRDLRNDSENLGRLYFPEVDLIDFTNSSKKKIEEEIEADFEEALKGIRMLPRSSRNGVYLGYYYYASLFRKIKQVPPNRILKERIRIPNYEKLFLIFKSGIRNQLNLI
jgi:15-cis-phytoene synthase